MFDSPRLWLACAGTALLAGCQATPTTEKAAPRALLVGFVRHAAPDPVIVVAIDRATNRVVHRAFLETGRRYLMPMDPGRYKVYAFADANRDGAAEQDELVSVAYVLADPLVAGDIIELPTLALTETLANAR